MKRIILAFIFAFVGCQAFAAPVIVVPGEESGYAFLATNSATQESSAFTVGAVEVFLSQPLPDGWLECDGSTVTSAAYPDLVEYLAGASATSAALPDYRGEFLRGWDHGRGLDSGRALNSLQGHQLKSHTHTATAAAAGGHTHSGSVTAGGAHTHIIPSVTPPNYSGSYLGSGGGYGRKVTGASTNAAGAHSHTGSLGVGGSHTHSGTLNAHGIAEFRPRNLAVIFAIRAKK